ncbi:hypothetical protein BBP40_011419 [Aspergillus hancockii]|nr:hypothetical protein BBP40_011419 [Aspergillus hancockii]
MSLDPSSFPRSNSPASSDSSLTRSRLRGKEEHLKKDKNYRRYASSVERALSLFDTALQEWADYISFLSRLLKALQSHPSDQPVVPHKVLVSKRLAQCLNPSLPSGVHQKALEVYTYIFNLIKSEGLSHDLPLYLPGIAPTLTFASLTVRPLFLSLVETYICGLEPWAIRPALKAIILALLPGLEEETSDDFDPTLRLINKFRDTASQMGVTDRRPSKASSSNSNDMSHDMQMAAESVVRPEPGLLIRCFASGLSDEQVLVQRTFLDLLVTHLPLSSPILQSRITEDDLRRLLIAAVGVMARRDMSLNRRLWAWLLGPDPTNDRASFEARNSISENTDTSRASDQELSQSEYFRKFGMRSLVRGLLQMIEQNTSVPSEKTRPFRISLSLMDRWEVGGHIVNVVFLPLMRNVQSFERVAPKSQFDEVFRSASTFFDGVESGVIFSELLKLIDWKSCNLDRHHDQVLKNLNLAQFILENFNVREEDMVLTHIPLLTLSVLIKLSELSLKDNTTVVHDKLRLVSHGLFKVMNHLTGLLTERAFSKKLASKGTANNHAIDDFDKSGTFARIQWFYEQSASSLDPPPSPFSPKILGELIIGTAYELAISTLAGDNDITSIQENVNLLIILLKKLPKSRMLRDRRLYLAICNRINTNHVEQSTATFSAIASIATGITSLYSIHNTGLYISYEDISDMIPSLVKQLWQYLSPLSPKFHVEAVRCLWHLHSTLSHGDRRHDVSVSEDNARAQSLHSIIFHATLRVLSEQTTTATQTNFDEIKLQQTSLVVMRQLLLGPGAEEVAESGIDSILVERLSAILDGGGSVAVQGALIDTLLAALKIILMLVDCFCKEIQIAYANLQLSFKRTKGWPEDRSEHATIALLTGLETCIATAHERLLVDEANVPAAKSPDQTHGFFGNMVSGVFASDANHGRSSAANNRLTVLLCFQDAVRLCFSIWSWGAVERSTLPQDAESLASFQYTSLRMRNRSRRILEHLFTAEALECLETLVEMWTKTDSNTSSLIFNLLHTLDGSRPKITIPAVFNAIYTRTNPSALDASRKSTLSSTLTENELAGFLVIYARSLDDDVLDEIWADCTTFLRDVLSNPFPHRQILPRLVEFAAILGAKLEHTNFGEDRRMRKELGDVLLRLLTAIFTSKPLGLSQDSSMLGRGSLEHDSLSAPQIGPDDLLSILATSMPAFTTTLGDSDRITTAVSAISTNVIGPLLRSRLFPNNINRSFMTLLQHIAKVPTAAKVWKKDIAEAFNDPRFFSSQLELVKGGWMNLLRQWVLADKDRLSELMSRLPPPSTAGIMFGVGASAARLDADRKAQLNLRRITLLILSSNSDYFVGELPGLLQKLEDLLGATISSSPSSTTRAEIFMVFRALALKSSTTILAPFWPLINTELQEAIAAIPHGPQQEVYNPYALLQACKLLGALLVLAPDDFQLLEWLYVTDTIDAVYPPERWEPIALADEISQSLGTRSASSEGPREPNELGYSVKQPGLTADWIREMAKDELVDRVLRPWFEQLSIHAFESTYSMSSPSLTTCYDDLLADLFNESTMAN